MIGTSRRGARRGRSVHADRSRRLMFEPLEVRCLLSAPPLWSPSDVVRLSDLSVSASTSDKPQSKVWRHDGNWWSVLPDSTGTWVRRLDGVAWNPVLRLSTETGIHADVKDNGNLTHVLLFDGTQSQLISLEYVSGPQPRYQPWSLQPRLVDVALSSGVESATIDVDSTGRLWLASDAQSTIEVRYSDYPYAAMSGPITVATGVTNDDICATAAMSNGKVGVLWSDQNRERFGFRTHVDGDAPAVWSAEEVPAAQSISSVGGGLADDHLNLAVASDGTVYAAVKTSFDSSGQPVIGLLVRRPAGNWDALYTVDTRGTRPIVLLNELAERLVVAYTSSNGGGNILYKESAVDAIAFATGGTLISGSLNDVTSTKQNITDELVAIASKGGTAAGVKISMPQVLPPPAPPPEPGPNQAPQVSAGPDQQITLPSAAHLAGTAQDDGLPQPPGTLTTAWSKLSGPGAVAFANVAAANTTATFTLPGDYVLRLTASDGELTAADDVAIRVLAITTVGVYLPNSSAFYLRNSNSGGAADILFQFGLGGEGSVPLVGDWDGDGRDTIGVYAPSSGSFSLRDSNSGGAADITFQFGPGGLDSIPLAGDWDGDGRDTVGVYVPSSGTFYLRNSNGSGDADLSFQYGLGGLGWVPLAGDWDGDGRDTVGVYVPNSGSFYLKNSNGGGGADVLFQYGLGGLGWIPLVGDWDGDRHDTAGVYLPASSAFYLRNSLSGGGADILFRYGLGGQGWLPIAGDWDGYGSPLRAAAGEAPAIGQPVAVTEAALRPIIAAALAGWEEAGVSASMREIMMEARFAVADLPDSYLGFTQGNTILIDRDAAGHRWFVDPTPRDNEEFSPGDRSGEGRALDAGAVDRIDLLTVVAHELGHIAGLDDLALGVNTLMGSTLSTGVRRTPLGGFSS